jgi:hypothetical protein
MRFWDEIKRRHVVQVGLLYSREYQPEPASDRTPWIPVDRQARLYYRSIRWPRTRR